MVRQLKFLHGHWTEGDVLPKLRDAEERLELISCSRLIGKALQRVHQGQLRLPTRRRARLLNYTPPVDARASTETCVAVRMAFHDRCIARLRSRWSPRRLRLPHQPQCRRL